MDTEPNEPVSRHGRWGIVAEIQQVSCSGIIRNTPKDAVPLPGKGKEGQPPLHPKLQCPPGNDQVGFPCLPESYPP